MRGLSADSVRQEIGLRIVGRTKLDFKSDPSLDRVLSDILLDVCELFCFS
jgi:hypothetical protein